MLQEGKSSLSYLLTAIVSFKEKHDNIYLPTSWAKIKAKVSFFMYRLYYKRTEDCQTWILDNRYISAQLNVES